MTGKSNQIAGFTSRLHLSDQDKEHGPDPNFVNLPGYKFNCKIKMNSILFN